MQRKGGATLRLRLTIHEVAVHGGRGADNIAAADGAAALILLRGKMLAALRGREAAGLGTHTLAIAAAALARLSVPLAAVKVALELGITVGALQAGGDTLPDALHLGALHREPAIGRPAAAIAAVAPVHAVGRRSEPDTGVCGTALAFCLLLRHLRSRRARGRGGTPHGGAWVHRGGAAPRADQLAAADGAAALVHLRGQVLAVAGVGTRQRQALRALSGRYRS